MELTDEIAAHRAGVGDPAALVGEFRRTAVLLPLEADAPMSGHPGGRYLTTDWPAGAPMTTEANVQKALTSVRKAAAAVDEEILAHQEGRGSVSSPGRLSTLRGALATMESQLDTGPLPPRPERLRGAGRAVADSWPFDSSLGKLILTAEQRYLAA